MPTLRSNADDLIGLIAAMDRRRVLREILQFRGRFRLDFTPAFLAAQTLEQLRHILLSAKLQDRRGH